MSIDIDYGNRFVKSVADALQMDLTVTNQKANGWNTIEVIGRRTVPLRISPQRSVQISVEVTATRGDLYSVRCALVRVGTGMYLTFCEGQDDQIECWITSKPTFKESGGWSRRTLYDVLKKSAIMGYLAHRKDGKWRCIAEPRKAVAGYVDNRDKDSKKEEVWKATIGAAAA